MKLEKNILFIICLFLSMSACIKNLDFDQLDDLTALPVFTTSLLFFEINESQFIDTSGNMNTVITETFNYKVLEDEFIKENLLQLIIDIEIKNQFNSNFTVIIEFLDTNNNLKYKLTELNILANQLDFTHKETILVNENRSLLDTSKIRITLNTASLSANQSGNFEFKSTATYYLKVD